MADETANETTEFSEWLKAAMDHRGITKQTTLASAAGIAQSTVSSYLSGVRKPEKRDQVEKLVRALLPEEAQEHTALYLLNDGLIAAGLAPVDSDEAEHEVIDYLRGKPGVLQDKALRLLKAAFDEEDATDNAGNVGKRPK